VLFDYIFLPLISTWALYRVNVAGTWHWAPTHI